MKSSTKRCPICDALLFRYPYKHNGKEKIMWRCSNFHGPRDRYGISATVVERIKKKRKKTAKQV